MDNFLIKQNQVHSSEDIEMIPVDACESYDEIIESSGQPCNSNSIQKKKIYRQKYRIDWTKEFGSWLIESENNNSFCRVCNQCIKGGRFHVKRHSECDHHKKNICIQKNTPKITNLLETDTSKLLQRKTREVEFKMVALLHEHNLPFVFMEHLPSFLKSICPESTIIKQIKCSRTKATAITKDCFTKEAIENIRKRLDNGVYSLIIDETTDVSTKKSLAVIIKFFDSVENRTVDKFLNLIRIRDGTANSIYTAVINCIEECQIPVSNLIGFAADNCSVMMGSKNGVQAKLQQINPHIYVMGCVCHSFHLCASAAAIKLPRCLEDFARNIYNYLSNSSKRMELLEEFQGFVNLKPHKILKVSQTRWLSLQAVVDRILENWQALTLFFTDAVAMDNLHTTENILSCLKDPVYELYFIFLAYILGIINKLNLEFQSETPKIQILNSRISEFYKLILKNFLKKSYLDKTPLNEICPTNPNNFTNDVYYGAKVEIFLSNKNVNPHELQNFKLRVIEFYVELAIQIKKRFNFDDPMLIFIEKFQPKNIIQGECKSIVTDTAKFFPSLFEEAVYEDLDMEWRLIPEIEVLKKMKNGGFLEFWKEVWSLNNQLDENEVMFPNINKLIKAILVLPHSSAAAERLFSKLNDIKTKKRNKLDVETCSAILHTKELLGKNACFDFQPSESLLNHKVHI